MLEKKLLTNIIKLSVETTDVPSFLNNSTLSITLWFSGCNLKCEGCHNYMIQDEKDGYSYEYIIKELKKRRKYASWLVLLGGEPLNSERSITVLYNIMTLIKEMNFSILLYTGYEYNEAINKLSQYLNKEQITELTNIIKFIKTGKYEEKEKKIKSKNYFFETTNQKINIFSTGEKIYFYNEEEKINI